MLDWYLIAMGVLLGIAAVPLAWIVYVQFGGNLIGDLLEKPPWSKTVRGIQIAMVPVVAYLAWKLDFREFAYGLTGIVGVLWAFLWSRALLRGEPWVMNRESRLSAEWAGPITLLALGIGFISSAINPWF